MWSATLRWCLATWPQWRLSSAPQTLSSTPFSLDWQVSGTVTTSLSGPERSSSPGILFLRIHFHVCSGQFKVESVSEDGSDMDVEYPFMYKKDLNWILFILHPSSGLWRCVWSTVMRWSSLVLDRRRQATRRESASAPRLVCFTGLGGEMAATCCLVMMPRMCIHTHW